MSAMDESPNGQQVFFNVRNAKVGRFGDNQDACEHFWRSTRS
jgi:hypothetical protein